MLANIHDAPTEGKFCDTSVKVIKPQFVVDYSCHVGYVDKGDKMANCYTTNHCTWKWIRNCSSIC
jgi:hypothetical protein